MAQFIQVPIDRLDPDILQSLLEEYASRNGTDYGVREFSLEEKVQHLREQLGSGKVGLVYDAASEEWDLLDSGDMAELER